MLPAVRLIAILLTTFFVCLFPDSGFIQQTLTAGYPRLLRLFHQFFSKISVHTDTVYTQNQQRFALDSVVFGVLSPFLFPSLTLHFPALDSPSLVQKPFFFFVRCQPSSPSISLGPQPGSTKSSLTHCLVASDPLQGQQRGSPSRGS